MSARRPRCERCERPRSVCYCAHLPSLKTESRVVILQHPREAGMPIGTGRMAHLCLPDSSLHVGTDWDEHEALREACADADRPAVLLYPGEGARDILADPPSRPITLIVVDGTWAQARAIVRDNPRLAALPRVAFTAPEPSTYRIRPEPDDTFTSTLEAVMHVLGALEGDADRFRPMLRPMQAMVDAQLEREAHAETHGIGRRVARVRKRDPRWTRLPASLFASPDRLVLVMAEANAWPHGTAEREAGDELIRWVAYRPSTGTWFDQLIAPRLPLAPSIPDWSGLDAEDLEAGLSREAFVESWGAWIDDDAVLASWGHHALRLLKQVQVPVPAAFVDLQDAAHRLANDRVGILEDYAATHELEPAESHPPARAGRRVALLAQLVADWRTLPTAEDTIS